MTTAAMRVAIVHYHLSPGGVSTVIRSHSAELTAAAIPHIILVGSASDSDLPVRIIEELGYRKTAGNLTAKNLLENLRQAATQALCGSPDLWHFHNHSLGKNALMAQVVDLLAIAGERLILHIHDLAEDGRAQNYPVAASPALYPVSSQIRYSFINSRDRNHFIAAGLPAENAVFLPNSITVTKPIPPSRELSPLLLYPSRAIRRKNLGELLLLSILFPTGTRIAVTRAPENPDAIAIHDAWKRFAETHHLPVAFSVVDDQHHFEHWLERATHFITTSVSEGFGLTYLESVAYQKPLIGRNLPDVTADHPFPIGRLYDRILIPTDWIDPKIIRERVERSLTETFQLYQRPLPEEIIEQTFAALHFEDHFDFGNLPEALQQSVIIRLLENPNVDFQIQSNGQIHPARHWLSTSLKPPKEGGFSAYRIHSFIHPIGGGQTPSLLDLFKNFPPPSPLTHLDSQKILTAYLTPDRFHFLLTASPERSSSFSLLPIRAVIFDIYGTLLIAPAGGVKPDPTFDQELTAILKSFGHHPPEKPTQALHHAVVRHHAASPHEFPEIDLRILWQEILNAPVEADLIQAIEDAWHPAELILGAAELIQQLSKSNIALGLLSNAQINTLPALGEIAQLFDPQLTILSYQHLIAKPSSRLFQILTERLAALNIFPAETLFIGNDPLQDILPAQAAGFRTALFTGHPDSLRPGNCHPDFEIETLAEILQIAFRTTS